MGSGALESGQTYTWAGWPKNIVKVGLEKTPQATDSVPRAQPKVLRTESDILYITGQWYNP